MIEVRNLVKRFGEIEAIRDVSFSIPKGQIVGFLGPNGAGKTTTLKIITCYLPPTSGTVSVAGRDVSEEGIEVRRTFGYVPENAPLYHDMLVIDYLRFMAQLHGMTGRGIRGAVDRVIGQTGLGAVAGQTVGTLSKGYRQRTCLAQALVHDPEILVLDEPTVGLDPNQIVEIRGLIREIGRERTVILSSHILPEVVATCDRLLVIHRGRIVADGTPRELATTRWVPRQAPPSRGSPGRGPPFPGRPASPGRLSSRSAPQPERTFGNVSSASRGPRGGRSSRSPGTG
jgi:ABC-2 type transport system ATP-binding protein